MRLRRIRRIFSFGVLRFETAAQARRGGRCFSIDQPIQPEDPDIAEVGPACIALSDEKGGGDITCVGHADHCADASPELLALNADIGILGVGGADTGWYLIGFDTSVNDLKVDTVPSVLRDGAWETVPVRSDFLTNGRTYAKFTSVVPEPGTALLMGLGLAGLGVAGRSRREES
jgi:hypothetical protein